MANDQRGAARGAVIQGRFIGGRFKLPGVTSPPAPIQPRMAGAQPIQPRMAQPHVAQRQPIQPGYAHPHINQHSAHLQRIAQAKMAQPRAVTPQAVQLRSATPQSPVVQRHGNGEAFQLPANLSNFGGGGQPLPGAVRQKMESFFGTSFADVRVHVGPQASAIGALAFTQGSNLYFAQGQYNPNTPQGQQILGHELTHVVQQRAGRVSNPFASGVAVVQDRSMEAEADRMGLRAAAHNVPVQGKMANTLQATPAKKAASPFPAPAGSQRQVLLPVVPPSNPLPPRRSVVQRQGTSAFTPSMDIDGNNCVVTQAETEGGGMFGHSELFIEEDAGNNKVRITRIHVETLGYLRVDIKVLDNAHKKNFKTHKSYIATPQQCTTIKEAARKINRKMEKKRITYDELFPNRDSQWKNAKEMGEVDMSCKSCTDALLIEAGLKTEYGGIRLNAPWNLDEEEPWWYLSYFQGPWTKREEQLPISYRNEQRVTPHRFTML